MFRCLILAVAVLAAVAAALHEDEVGSREWVQTNVGIATKAAFHGSLSSPAYRQVYITSEQGALAAIGTAKNAIRWRTVSADASDPFVCVFPQADTVVAISAKGTTTHFAALTGAVLSTDSIATDGSRAHLRVLSCAGDAQSDSISVIATTVMAATAVELFVLASDGTFTSQKAALTTAADTAAVVDNGKAAYILAKDGTLVYVKVDAGKAPLETSPIASVKALSIASASFTSASVLVRLVDRKTTVRVVGDAVVSDALPACAEGSHCKFAFVATASPKGDISVVTISRPKGSATLAIAAGTDFSASLAFPGQWSPNVLAATIHEGKASTKLHLLVADCHSDLYHITLEKGNPKSAAIVWRRFEGLSAPVLVKVADQVMLGGEGAARAEALDKFGIDHAVFVLARYGMLYRVNTLPSRAQEEPVRVADIAEVVGSVLHKVCVHSQITFTRMTVGMGIVVVMAKVGPTTVIVEVSAQDGSVVSTTVVPNATATVGHMVIDADRKVHVAPSEAQLPVADTYAVDLADINKGVVRGLVFSAAGIAIPTWQAKFRAQSIVAHATANSHLAVLTTENLRVFANASSKINEVRRKYLTGNILVIATVEPALSDDKIETTALVLTAIDIVTGNTVATGRYLDAAGPVHVMIIEHVIIFHYFNTERHRYVVGSWELFEQETSSVVNDASFTSIALIVQSFFIRPRAVSSYTARPPIVAAQTLAFPPGAITAMSSTVSFNGIARKLIVFAAADGHVYAVDLRHFIIGGVPLAPNQQAPTFVPTPSATIVSHRNPVYAASVIAASPTKLESSAHVVVAGLDLFYVRLSAGKAWDQLNDDFNYGLLINICVALAVLTFVARWFAARKALSLQWA